MGVALRRFDVGMHGDDTTVPLLAHDKTIIARSGPMSATGIRAIQCLPGVWLQEVRVGYSPTEWSQRYDSLWLSWLMLIFKPCFTAETDSGTLPCGQDKEGAREGCGDGRDLVHTKPPRSAKAAMSRAP